MPTAMKKRPSRRPLNGSISVSSSRRYSLSASSTPARKAPSAIDRPTASISAAVATTSSSEAAVKISGVSLRAIQRSIGRSSKRPPRMMTAIMPIALAAPSQPSPSWPAAKARKGSRAMIGIAATSCSSETLTMLSPEVVVSTLRSARTPRPIAVDDIARPSPATTATCQSMPRASAPSPSSRAEPNSWTLPQPKMVLRSDQRRCGSSSRPTRNSISTTPNSANCSISSGLVTNFNPHGPIRMPANR